MKVIRSCLAALLMFMGLGSTSLLTLGVGGCGGADESGSLVDGSGHSTTPAGETAGAGTTGGDDVLPTGDGGTTSAGGTTGGSATAGGDTTGGTATSGDTTGGDTAGGDTTGTTTGTLPPAVIAPQVTNVGLDASSGNIIFKVAFNEPIDYASLTSKKSIILTSDAKVALGAVAAVFTFGAVDPIEVGTIPGSYIAGDSNATVYLVVSPAEAKKFRLKDSEGNWQVHPYHLIVFGNDTSPSGYRARAVKDAMGTVLPNETRQKYECGSGKGKIPCGETQDLVPESH